MTAGVLQGAPVTTLDVARTVVELTGSKSELRLRPGDEEPDWRHLDLRAAREAFGFEAGTGLRKGLKAILVEEYGLNG